MAGSTCTKAEEDYSNDDTSICTPCHHACLPYYQPETISQAVRQGYIIYPVIRDTSFHRHTIGGFNCVVWLMRLGGIYCVSGLPTHGHLFGWHFFLVIFPSSVQVLLIFRNAGFKFRGFKYLFRFIFNNQACKFAFRFWQNQNMRIFMSKV